MIELVMSVCLFAEPARCREKVLTFEAESVSAHECQMYAPFEMAKWAGQHEAWRITRWTCRPAGQVAKI